MLGSLAEERMCTPTKICISTKLPLSLRLRKPSMLIWQDLLLIDSLLQDDPRQGVRLLPGQTQVTRN